MFAIPPIKNQNSLLWMILILELMAGRVANVDGGLIKRDTAPQIQNETTPAPMNLLDMTTISVKTTTTNQAIQTTAKTKDNQTTEVNNNSKLNITTIIVKTSSTREPRTQIFTTTDQFIENTRNPEILQTTTLIPNADEEFTTNTSDPKETKVINSETNSTSIHNEKENPHIQDLIITTTSTESLRTAAISQPISKKYESDLINVETTQSSSGGESSSGRDVGIRNVESTTLDLSDRNHENFKSTTTYKADLSLTTTTTMKAHTPKLNKNYDIVTNEIRNSSMLVGNIITTPRPPILNDNKRAKYIKENSTNSNDLILPETGEVWALAGMKKQTDEKENHTNKTEIKSANQNVLNNNNNGNKNNNNNNSNGTDSSKLLTDWSVIMKNMQNLTFENLNETKNIQTQNGSNSTVLSLLNFNTISPTLQSISTTLSSIDSTGKSNSNAKVKIPLPLANNENRDNNNTNDNTPEKNNNFDEIIETKFLNSSSVNYNNNSSTHKSIINGMEGNLTDGISSTQTNSEGKSNQVKLETTTIIVETTTIATSTQKPIENVNNNDNYTTRIENTLNAQPKKDIINVNSTDTSTTTTSTSSGKFINNNSTKNLLQTESDLFSTLSTTEQNSLDISTNSDSLLDVGTTFSTTEQTTTTWNNIMDTTTIFDQQFTENQSTEVSDIDGGSTLTTISSSTDDVPTTTNQIDVEILNKFETESSLMTDDGLSTTTTNYFPATGPESSIETNTIDKNYDSGLKTDTTTKVSGKIVLTLPSTTFSSIETKGEETQVDNNQVDIFFSTFPTKNIKDDDQDPPQGSISSNIIPMITDITTESPITTQTNILTSHIPEMEGIDANSTEPDYNVIIAISVSVVGIVALILLIGFLYVMRKRQKLLTYGQRCRPVSLDAYSLDNVSVYNSVRRKAAMRASKRSYGNAAFDDPSLVHNNMGIIDLAKFVDRKSAIYDEFKDIPQIIARADEVPPGCEDKNRYANVIPLPETRVILQQLNGDEKTEYINANYVRGPKDTPNYYIACQAPLEGTVVDFWRMIWEQNSRVIIMATDLIENGIEKCAEYLPASITLDNHTVYGDYQITLKNRDVKDKYAVSTLHVKNMQTNAWREITHFWYQWPEAGVPSDEAGVIAMLLEARSCLKVSATEQIDDDSSKLESNGTTAASVEQNGNIEKSSKSNTKNQQGPLTVHCSPGTGRTGTIITSDIALRSLETTKRIDIPQIVYYVRRGRASAVQTKDQYDFIYRVTHMYATKISGPLHENC